jgi:hypothetical protein
MQMSDQVPGVIALNANFQAITIVLEFLVGREANKSGDRQEWLRLTKDILTGPGSKATPEAKLVIDKIFAAAEAQKPEG